MNKTADSGASSNDHNNCGSPNFTVYAPRRAELVGFA
jgi:hypothetical protein